MVLVNKALDRLSLHLKLNSFTNESETKKKQNEQNEHIIHEYLNWENGQNRGFKIALGPNLAPSDLKQIPSLFALLLYVIIDRNNSFGEQFVYI